MTTTATVQAKAWWQSKTIWLGIVQFLLGLAELITTTPILQGSEIAAIAVTVSGVLTFIFRFMTERPVAVREQLVQVER